MKKLLALMLSLLPLTVGAQGVFSKYAPVSGIQKSTGLDYHNTAAAASDVTPLFGCGGSSSLFLRGDGSCVAPAGTGVSSISVPVPLTATACSGGACSITWTTGQTANRVLATPDGTTGAVSLRALVAGDVPPINLGSTANGGVSSSTILLGTNGGTSNAFFSVTGPATALRTFTFPNASATMLTTNAAVTVAQGGTGLGTLTAHGVLLGEGTSNAGSVAAMAADTLLQGQGVTADPAAVAINNCGSSSTALSYSTSTHTFGCQTISVGGTGTVTSITGGTGITASPNPITSTGTLTVDQAFTPTWSATHIFSAAYAGLNTGPIKFVSTQPGFSFDNTSAAANAHWWDFVGTVTDLLFRSLDDAGTAHNLLDATRSGATISNVSFGNATDNPTYSFLGTGGATLGGNVTSSVSGSGQVVVTTSSVTTGNFVQGDFCNSAHCLHALNTTTGQSTAFITNGIGGEAAYVYTDTAPLCLGSNATCRVVVGTTGGVTINTPTSGPALTVGGTSSASQGAIVTSAGAIESAVSLLPQFVLNSAGANFGLFQNDATGSWSLAYGTVANALGTPVLKWNSTGNVTIPTPASGEALVINALANNYGVDVLGSATSGQSYGVLISAGTTSADQTFQARSQAGTTFLLVRGDGGVLVGNPTGGDKGLGSVNMTGCFVNGAACLTSAGASTKFAGGVMTSSAGNTCVVNQNNGGIASCAEGAAGNINITFTTSYYTTSAACVVSGTNGSPLLDATTQGTFTGGTLNVLLRNSSSSALTDGSFTLACVGS